MQIANCHHYPHATQPEQPAPPDRQSCPLTEGGPALTDYAPVGASKWIACHCCGRLFPAENVLRFRDHPDDALCVCCVEWLHVRSRPIVRRLYPIWQLPARLRARTTPRSPCDQDPARLTPTCLPDSSRWIAGRRPMARGRTRASVSSLTVDDVEQRLPEQEAAQVVGEEPADRFPGGGIATT